jgi:hypothetical protein
MLATAAAEPEWVFSEGNVVDLGMPVLAERGPFAVDPQLAQDAGEGELCGVT